VRKTTGEVAKYTILAMAGVSTRGWIAQCFVRKYPHIVDKLFLVNVALPDAYSPEKFLWVMKMVENDCETFPYFIQLMHLKL